MDKKKSEWKKILIWRKFDQEFEQKLKKKLAKIKKGKI